MSTEKLHVHYVEWLKNKHPGVAAVSPSKFREIYTNCYNIVPRYVKCKMNNGLNIIFDK